MATLITLLFQGKVETSAPLSATEEREVVHAAFPMSPPRDATSRPDYRAWKIVPLTSGRILLSTVLNRDEKDAYDRPVLRANGCLLAAGEMAGGWRDPVAIWQALEEFPGETDLSGDVESFAGRVEALSIHTAPEAFALFRGELDRSGPFHARAAAVLSEETADLYLGDVGRGLDLLRPALGLLPRERLERLHLSIGGEASDAREPILGLPGGAPDTWREGGLLSGLFGRKKDDQSEAAADFETQEVFGTRADGPSALAEAIVDPLPWPGVRGDRDRYRVLLECLDTGGSRTPFDAVPELDDLRQAIHRIERLAKELARGR